MRRVLHSGLLILLTLLAACEKKDTAVMLPPKGEAIHNSVDMGEEYLTQLFFDFETNSVVYTSTINDWDLAFEAAPTGFHVFMNDPKWKVYNTHVADFGQVTMPPKITDKDWKFDASCGLPDSTAIGDWTSAGQNSKGEVYIMENDSDVLHPSYVKVMLLSFNDKQYVFGYGSLTDIKPQIVTVPKDYSYNYSYFSFSKGLIQMEPPKDTWDIVFTRYKYIYHDLNNFPYTVTGALLNPYKTTAVQDSITAFDNINSASINGYQYSDFRDVIGFNWKSFDYSNPTTASYITNPKKCYVVNTRKGQYYKLHFLDFYSPTKMKGHPTFEFVRLQ